MRIAIDGTPAINDIRAIKRYAWNLLRQISLLELEDEYIALFFGAGGVKDIEFPLSNNSKIRAIKSKIPGRLLNLAWKFLPCAGAEFFVKEKIDIFHFTGGAAYIPVKAGVIVTTMHGFHQQMIPGMADRNTRTEVLTKLEQTVSKSNHFITVSNTNKEELNRLWAVPLDKITVIPLGIGDEFLARDDIGANSARIRKKYAVGEKEFLLFVGAIEPHKNIQGIIEAFSLLDDVSRNNFNLVLVGVKTKYNKTYVERAEKLGISDQLVFIDYIEPGSEDLALLYQMAKVFVFPTFYEGWASPPLEALKCGTPALVSEIPSLRESTGGKVLYCNPYDPRDISSQIQKILEDKELCQKIKKEGFEFASEYTWSRCAEKTLELYHRLSPKIKEY